MSIDEHKIKQLETEIASVNALFEQYQKTANYLVLYKQSLIAELTKARTKAFGNDSFKNQREVKL